jgi:hypothetical protein
VLWQRHNLRPEEFEAMPRSKQLFFIASELEEDANPTRYIRTIKARKW